MEKLEIPDFLYCEEVNAKDNSIDEIRVFIYCPKFLSLIEIIPIDEMLAIYPSENYTKTYFYEDEEFQLVILQNNIEVGNSANDLEILKGEFEPMTNEKLCNLAFNYYIDFLKSEEF